MIVQLARQDRQYIDLLVHVSAERATGEEYDQEPTERYVGADVVAEGKSSTRARGRWRNLMSKLLRGELI